MDLNNFHENEDVEPGELLEDCWFFGNLLHTKSKSRMLRSFSDPCSSSNFPGNSYEETYESIKKTTTTTKEIRSNRKAPSKRNSLVRAPSLPTSLANDQDFHDEEEEEEREFSMGKLIRQASLTRPPRKNASKSFTAGSSFTRQKSRRKPEAESVKPPPPPATATEDEEVRPQRANKLRAQKSLKDSEIEELRGFKDLGLDFNGKDLSSSAAIIIPGLQEKKRVEEEEEEYEERRGARPQYVSAAQRAAPPVPRWGGKRPTEDMKAQIKFWARAVASNVRQEC